jgi:hypothetical protein
VGEQCVADLPGGGVEQVRRAVVDGVIVDPVPDGEHGVLEARRPCPAEAHALVTGDVHDEAAALERRQIVVDEEHRRVVGVLQHAVDDDVVLGDEVRERHGRAVLEGDDAAVWLVGRVLVMEDVHEVDRVGHRVDLAGGQHVDVMDTQAIERADRPSCVAPNPITAALSGRRP